MTREEIKIQISDGRTLTDGIKIRKNYIKSVKWANVVTVTVTAFVRLFFDKLKKNEGGNLCLI